MENFVAKTKEFFESTADVACLGLILVICSPCVLILASAADLLALYAVSGLLFLAGVAGFGWASYLAIKRESEAETRRKARK